MRSDRPETLYDLMAQVADEIEAAPEFYYQGRWSRPVDAKGHWDPTGATACGTAFCRAGHMISIIDSCKGITRTPTEWDHVHIATRARRLLEDAGVPESEVLGLFHGCAVAGRVGTKEYAKKGADGIRTFMQAHEANLKAYKLDKVYEDASRRGRG